VVQGNADLVQILVEACADVRLPDSTGLTPKRLARKYKTYHLVSRYLKLPYYASCVIDHSHTTGHLSLNLSKCKLRSFPLQSIRQIHKLQHIQRLDLSRNKLDSLPPVIGRLTSLVALNLAQNDIVALPATMANLVELVELDVTDNPLMIPPKAIAKRGAKDVLVYLTDLLNSTTNQWLDVRVMCVGAENVGKSTLLDCLATKSVRPQFGLRLDSPLTSLTRDTPRSSSACTATASTTSVAAASSSSASSFTTATPTVASNTSTPGSTTAATAAVTTAGSATKQNLSTDGIDVVEWVMQGMIQRNATKSHHQSVAQLALETVYSTEEHEANENLVCARMLRGIASPNVRCV
jgi:hypothetical protein